MNPALVSLSLILFTLTTINLPLSFSKEAEQVLDNFGRPIFPGGRFYIEPDVIDRKGGGVKLDITGNSTCPVTILQDYSEGIHGMTVKFNIPGISLGVIYVGTPLNIAFEDSPECAESSNWVVVEDDDFPRKWFGIGGDNGHSGKKILSGTFNIQKDGLRRMRYKLVFCPTVVDNIAASLGACFDVGRYKDEKGMRLVLNTDKDQFPFYVTFVDANRVNLSGSYI